MCPKGQWEKLTKSSWVRSMSPFDQKLLDIRMPHSSFQILEVSIEEGTFCMIFAYFPFSSISDISNSFIYLFIYFAEFFLYRIIFLVLGIVMLMLASSLSKSLVFYYSSAMAIGVLLIILMILFQVVLYLWFSNVNT